MLRILNTEPGPAARTAGWIALLGAVTVVFFWECLFQNRSLLPTDLLNQVLLPGGPPAAEIAIQNHYPIDEVLQMAPAAQFWRDRMLAGQLPLWNPNLYGGQPHFASTVWGVLSPFKLHYLIMPIERAYTLGLIGQWFLAGVTMFAFLRELGRSRPAAFIGGCAFMLSSNILMFFWLHLNVFVWVPLALLGWERFVKTHSWRWGFLCGITLTLAMTGGNIQMMFFVGLLWGIYVLGSFDWRERKQWKPATLQILQVSLFAAGLCAVQVVPCLEFLRLEAMRLAYLPSAGTGLRHSLLGPLGLASFLFPGLPGSPQSMDALKLIDGSLYDFTGYIGVIPWILAGVSLVTGRDRRTNNLLLLIAAVLVIVFLTPLRRFVYHRIFILVIFAACTLAADGYDKLSSLLSDKQRAVRRIFLWMAAVGIVAALALLGAESFIAGNRSSLTGRLEQKVAAQLPGHIFNEVAPWVLGRVPKFLDHYRISNPVFLIPVVTLLVAGAGWLSYSHKRISRQALLAGLVLLTVMDLSLTLRGRVPRVDLARYPYYPDQPLLAPLRTDPEPFRVYRWMPKQVLPYRDNILMAYGYATVTGYDSMGPRNLRFLFDELTPPSPSALNVANVKYVIMDAADPLPPGRFEPVLQHQGLKLLRNMDCLPRFSWVPHWRVIGSQDAALKAATSPDFDPRKETLLEEAPEFGARPGGETQTNRTAVELVSVAAERAVANVQSAAPGVLVFADTWYPGWEVRVDGRKAKLLRANGVMKAVAAPPGTHTVEFAYRPLSFRIGLAITSFAFAAGCVGLWMAGRRPRVPLPSVQSVP